MSKKYFVKYVQHFSNAEKVSYFGPYGTKAQALVDIEKESAQVYHLESNEVARPTLAIVRLATHTQQGKRYTVAPSLFASK